MTKTPHRQSFLAFACLLQEHFEYTDYSVAVHGSITMATDEACARVHGYYSQTNSYEGCSLFVETKLRTLVSPKALNRPDTQLFIAEYASTLEKLTRLEKQIAGFEKFRGKAPAVHSTMEGAKDVIEFRPRRETQVNIIVGAYLSLPDDVRTWARAADLLNRGIQGKVAGLNDGHVRNALYAAARRAHRFYLTDLAVSEWARALFDWYVLDHIWDKARANFRPNDIDVAFLDELRATGLFEEWRLEAEYRASKRCVPSRAQLDVMLDVHLDVLKNLKRKIDRKKTA